MERAGGHTDNDIISFFHGFVNSSGNGLFELNVVYAVDNFCIHLCILSFIYPQLSTELYTNRFVYTTLNKKPQHAGVFG